MKSPFRILASLALAFAVLLPAGVQAQAMSDYWENKAIDFLLRGQAYTPPTTIYFGLSTTACSDSSTGTEVSTSGTGYARVGVTSNMTNWAGTQSAGSTTASTGTGGQTSNNVAVTFGAPTADWHSGGNQVGWFFASDAPTAGNILFCAALSSGKNVSSGDAAPSFAIGAMTFTIQ